MKTKYILHGGFADHENEKNNDFFQEILKDAPNRSTILLVYFAKEVADIPEKKKRNIEQFMKNNEGKHLTFQVAEEELFFQKVGGSHVIYLHGGNTLSLLNALKKHSHLKELFKGKVIAGESAGAYVLSTVFYSKTIGKVVEGLEHVPVKTICHYIGNNEEKLETIAPHLEMLLLPDYEYKVYGVE